MSFIAHLYGIDHASWKYFTEHNFLAFDICGKNGNEITLMVHPHELEIFQQIRDQIIEACAALEVAVGMERSMDHDSSVRTGS